LEVEVVKRIVSALSGGPKPINQLAKEVGIGWKTCDRYLESLKLLGQVEEVTTPRERILSIRIGRGGWLLPRMSRIRGNKAEWADEAPTATEALRKSQAREPGSLPSCGTRVFETASITGID